jgi:hypothetical protein
VRLEKLFFCNLFPIMAFLMLCSKSVILFLMSDVAGVGFQPFNFMYICGL